MGPWAVSSFDKTHHSQIIFLVQHGRQVAPVLIFAHLDILVLTVHILVYTLRIVVLTIDCFAVTHFQDQSNDLFKISKRKADLVHLNKIIERVQNSVRHGIFNCFQWIQFYYPHISNDTRNTKEIFELDLSEDQNNDCQNDGKLSDVAKREEDKASDITAKGGETKVKKEGLFQVYLTKH